MRFSSVRACLPAVSLCVCVARDPYLSFPLGRIYPPYPSHRTQRRPRSVADGAEEAGRKRNPEASKHTKVDFNKPERAMLWSRNGFISTPISHISPSPRKSHGRRRGIMQPCAPPCARYTIIIGPFYRWMDRGSTVRALTMALE